jgi:hypothetical protein
MMCCSDATVVSYGREGGVLPTQRRERSLMDVAARLDSGGQYRCQFEQSLAVVRVGWNFKSFFLAPAAPGWAFPVERSGITTASGTPN